jgi:exodeoxyribonuclease V beta subunit
VFVTAAAEEWRRFLLAVERPDRPDMVRLAATTLLVGMTPVEVAALDDADVLDLQHQAKAWREMLHTGGVPALLERLGRERDLAGRVLATPEGERTMTDLVHIAEELHTVWRRGRTGSLVGWLETTMAEARIRAGKNLEEPESRQRRLETDAAAVEVQTVHGAKGLEYPVVLVPYAWDVGGYPPDIPVFHEPKPAGGAQTPKRRLADVAGPRGPDFDDHCAAAMAEDAAEESRLLYVAMTRARHRLVVWWVEKNDDSAATLLSRMVSGPGRSPEDLVAASGGTIAHTMLRRLPDERRHVPPPGSAASLATARFERSLDHLWRRASFTSLSPAHPLAAAVDTSEHRVRDDETPLEESADESDGDAVAPAAPPVPAIGLPMAELPRGARFGTLVHDVFEHADLAGGDQEGEVRRVLAAAPPWTVADLDIDGLVEGIVAAAETPLGPDPTDVRLIDLASGSVLDEMTFELPVRTDGPPLTLGDLGSVILEHLPSWDPFRRFATDLVTGLQRPFRGYLTGAIDVTAAVPGPDGVRYVVMDYKSNALPALGEAATAHDYGPAPLAEAMIDGNYVLQATLYQVALHRYLQWRLAGYDPHRHLGGAMYLFIRGMAGPDTPVVDGERCGVARWRPPPDRVVARSALFREPAR